MAGRPLGRKNIRSYLASTDMEKLNINPIEKAANCIQELDDLIAMNITAFKSGRGLLEKSDAGSQYLSNAIRGVTEKAAIYMTMARFKYPTLSAVAVKDFSEKSNNTLPMNTTQAIDVISNDPFFKNSVDTKDIIAAMNRNEDDSE